MSGSTSSSLNTLENSLIQDSVLSKSRSTSGPSTPSFAGSRPSSASSASGPPKADGSRPGSEKKSRRILAGKTEQKSPRVVDKQPSKARTPVTPQSVDGQSKSTVRPHHNRTPRQPVPRSIGTPSGSATTTPSTDSPGETSGAKYQRKKRFDRPRTTKTGQTFFEPYFCIADVQEGLKRGELIEGVLRINPKSYEDAYISAPNGGPDLYVGGIPDRNRALNGDVVVLKLKPSNEWKVLEENVYNYLAIHPEEKTFSE